jgi:hypothetical protein
MRNSKDGARPYGGLSQVRPYRGLRPRLACGSWIARFQHLIDSCKSERTKVVPKGLDEIHYGDASKKANGKVLHATLRHWFYTLEGLQNNHSKTNVCGIGSIEIRPWILQVISHSYAELRIR